VHDVARGVRLLIFSINVYNHMAQSTYISSGSKSKVQGAPRMAVLKKFSRAL